MHEPDSIKRLQLETATLKIAKDDTILISQHWRPITLASQTMVKSVDFRSNNKLGHQLTQIVIK